MQKTTLGKNKKILDAEIWKIFEVIKIAKQKYIEK